MIKLLENSSVSSLIKNYRKYKNLSVEQLSTISGLSKNTIYEYESYKKDPLKIRRNQFKKLVDALKIPDDDVRKVIPDYKKPDYTNVKDVRDLIKSSRKSQAYNLNDITKLIGRDPGYWSDFEIGKGKISTSDLIKLSNVLKIPEEEIKKFIPSFSKEIDYSTINDYRELIRKEIEYRGLEIKDIIRKTDLTKSQIMRSYKAQTAPKENLKKIFQALEISPEVYQKLVPSLNEEIIDINQIRNFGDLIRKYRKSKYRSISEFSRISGISYGTLSSLERNLWKTSDENLTRIMNQLEIPIEHMIKFFPNYNKKIILDYKNVKALGDLIRLHREFLGLSGEDVTKQLGMSIDLSTYEKNKGTPLRYTMKRLADFLNIPKDQILRFYKWNNYDTFREYSPDEIAEFYIKYYQKNNESSKPFSTFLNHANPLTLELDKGSGPLFSTSFPLRKEWDKTRKSKKISPEELITNKISNQKLKRKFVEVTYKNRRFNKIPTENYLIKFIESDRNLVEITKLVGNDPVTFAHIISIMYGLQRKDLVKLLYENKPLLRDYMGKFVKGINSIQDIEDLAKATLPFDKENKIKNILIKSGTETVLKKLGPKPSNSEIENKLKELELRLNNLD